MARPGRHHRRRGERLLRPQAIPRARHGRIGPASSQSIRAALLAIVAGSAVLAGAALIPSPNAQWERGFERAYDLASPFAATPETVISGRAIYRARCLACHGERGRGDGPAGAALVPLPADLVLHVPQHTEGELFYYVSRGIPATAMPAWERVLSESERWEVVHYLYELAAGAP